MPLFEFRSTLDRVAGALGDAAQGVAGVADRVTTFGVDAVEVAKKVGELGLSAAEALELKKHITARNIEWAVKFALSRTVPVPIFAVLSKFFDFTCSESTKGDEMYFKLTFPLSSVTLIRGQSGMWCTFGDSPERHDLEEGLAKLKQLTHKSDTDPPNTNGAPPPAQA